MTNKRHKGLKQPGKNRRAPPEPLAVNVSAEVLSYLSDMGAAHGNLSPEEMAAVLLARHVERKVKHESRKGDALFASTLDDDLMGAHAETTEDSSARPDHLNFRRIAARSRSDHRLASLLASEVDSET